MEEKRAEGIYAERRTVGRGDFCREENRERGEICAEEGAAKGRKQVEQSKSCGVRSKVCICDSCRGIWGCIGKRWGWQR